MFEVYALRLGSADRLARDNFLAPGDRNGSMKLDFTMWLIRGGDQLVAVDTGFNPYSGDKRNRTLLKTPTEALAALAVDAARVGTLVLTHLHFDHAGNVDQFSSARVLVQARELEYVTGGSMCHPRLNHFYEVEDVVGLVRSVYTGDVQVVDGFRELAPGLELHLIGGHTRGLQIVRVRTERGWVVLASDALHYYANLEENNPFPALVDLPQMLDGYRTIIGLADDSTDHVIPGHDPLVFDRYPMVDGNPDVVALHQSHNATRAKR
jgi:glyoxylase-like metal-dependent hydrolase (beta-lactamase superfamily II)